MNDEQLIQLLQDKTPEELSLAEIDLLRRRLAASDSLRQALFEQLEMEQYLAEALGRVNVSVETIAPKKPIANTQGLHPVLLAILGLLCLGMIGFISLVIVAAMRGPEDKPVAVVERDPPSVEEDVPPVPEDVVEASQPPINDPPPVEADDATDEPADPPPADPPPKVEEPTPPAGPWVAELAAPPLPFEQAWSVDFDTDRHVPAKQDIETWFAAVPGQKVRFYDEKIQNVNHGAIQGLARLQAPLEEDTALRFSTSKSDQLRIHCYRGEQGVSIYGNTRHGSADQWATYRVTREGDKPTPATFQLTDTDERRDELSDARYGPTLLLRWHAGELILSRGDVEMARAGFPDGPPTDVYFEGEAAFRGIEMLRLSDQPASPDTWPEPYEIAERPADLNWTQQTAEGAVVKRRDDGSLQLTCDKVTAYSWLATPLPTDRIRLVEVELDDVTPGAQVFLGPQPNIPADSNAETPVDRPDGPTLCFGTNDRDKQMAVVWKRRDDGRQTLYYHEVQEKAVPYAGPRTWVRFLVAAGWVRCWISVDGQRWALLNSGEASYSGQQTHLGIACSHATPGAAVTVRQIRYRALPAINGLVDPEILNRAQPVEGDSSYAQWLVAVSHSQPSDVTAEQWRTASAIRQLAVGGDASTLQTLLAMLLDTHNSADTPAEEQLALLREVAALTSPWAKLPHDQTLALPDYYWAVGRQLAEAGSDHPFTAVRHAMMTDLPRSRTNFRSYDPELIRLELIRLAYAGDWQEIDRTIEQLKFFGGSKLDDTVPLVPWLELLATRHQPRSVGDGVERLPGDWQNPLVEQYSKDAYNVMAEFHAALDSESYDDASRMIADLNPYAVAGLVPSSRDSDLLVSAATAIGSALARDQQLSQKMNSEFAPLGQLRVKQASAAGDVAAVRLATVQFQGTPAAGLAHRWLGDRALAGGQFVQAIAEYRKASAQVGVVERREITTRIRLAAAMLGVDLGEAPTSAVQIGEVSMNADAFEKLVAEMRTTHADSAAVLQQSLATVGTTVAPTGFKVHRRARLDGDPGDAPNQLDAAVRENNLPWLARQLGITIDGDIAYVNNRFHVAAYNLANTGQRLWQSPAPPHRGRAHDWSMTSMRPLVIDERVIVRQLTKYGPLLLCLDKANGKHLWVQEPPKDEAVLSDPVLAEGKLFALTLLDSPRGEDQLRLCSFSIESGQLIDAHDLLNVRDAWQQTKVCRATQLPDGLIATLGGFAVNVGFDGEVRWARRQLALPASQEPTWITQRFDRPMVSDDRVIIATPGVRAVSCLELDSGRLLWQNVMPNVDRLIGLTEGNVIIHAGDEYLALDVESGEQRWATAITDPYDAELCDGEHEVLIGHRVTSPTDPNKRCPELVWLNASTGEVTARTVLPDLNQDQPRFGPLLQHGDSLWTFFGNGADEPHRDLIQLEPQSDVSVEGAATSPSPVSPWLAHTREEQRNGVAQQFPQWNLLAAANRDAFGYIASIHNEKEVVALPADGNSALVLGREIAVPKTGKPRLRLRFGNDPNHHWRLTVRLGEKVLAEKEIDWKKKPEIWKDQTISLAPVAGQTGWLTVEATFIDHGDHSRTYWKRLDMQF